MADSNHPELDHLIYDGMATPEGGSVRPTERELPPLKPATLTECIRIMRELEQMPEDQLTKSEREWLEFVQFKIDDWNSDYDPQP